MEQELVHDLVAAYALDALDDSERREFEEHLATCEDCSTELAGLQNAATALAYVPEGPVRLPRCVSGCSTAFTRSARRMSSRSAAASRCPPSRPSPSSRRPPRSSSRSGGRPVELARHEERRAGRPLQPRVEARAARCVERRRDRPRRTGRGRVGAIPAPAGKTYELWVIDGKSVRPAGLFSKGTSGAPVLLTRRAPRGSQVGLSLEPAGGRTDHPTIVIAASQTL